MVLLPPENFNHVEQDWEPVSPFPAMASGRSFVSGNPEGNGLRVRYFKNKSSGNLLAKAWFGPETEGPPGFAHGGSMAALLDEVMGGMAWMSGHPVLAARLVNDFRQSLPLGTVVQAEGVIESINGRKVHTRGALRGMDGQVFCEGQGLFIILDEKQLDIFKKRFAERAK